MHNKKWQAESSGLLYRQSISHCTRMLHCFLQPQEVSILGEYSKFPSSHFSLVTDLSQRRLLVPVPSNTTCSNKKISWKKIKWFTPLPSNWPCPDPVPQLLKRFSLPLPNDCSKRVCTHNKCHWPPSTLVKKKKKSLDTDSACPAARTAGLIL